MTSILASTHDVYISLEQGVFSSADKGYTDPRINQVHGATLPRTLSISGQWSRETM